MHYSEIGRHIRQIVVVHRPGCFDDMVFILSKDAEQAVHGAQTVAMAGATLTMPIRHGHADEVCKRLGIEGKVLRHVTGIEPHEGECDVIA